MVTSPPSDSKDSKKKYTAKKKKPPRKNYFRWKSTKFREWQANPTEVAVWSSRRNDWQGNSARGLKSHCLVLQQYSNQRQEKTGSRSTLKEQAPSYHPSTFAFWTSAQSRQWGEKRYKVGMRDSLHRKPGLCFPLQPVPLSIPKLQAGEKSLQT